MQAWLSANRDRACSGRPLGSLYCFWGWRCSGQRRQPGLACSQVSHCVPGSPQLFPYFLPERRASGLLQAQGHRSLTSCCPSEPPRLGPPAAWPHAFGCLFQDGDLSFPLESVKQLKDLQEELKPRLVSHRRVAARLAQPVTPSLCSHPAFPEALKPLCQKPNAEAILRRLSEWPPG